MALAQDQDVVQALAAEFKRAGGQFDMPFEPAMGDFHPVDQS